MKISKKEKTFALLNFTFPQIRFKTRKSRFASSRHALFNLECSAPYATQNASINALNSSHKHEEQKKAQPYYQSHLPMV